MNIINKNIHYAALDKTEAATEVATEAATWDATEAATGAATHDATSAVIREFAYE
jgi:hypothetical protein